MPSFRTELTEITTGLGMLGFADLDHALSAPPRSLVGVSEETFGLLREARSSEAHADLFDIAWQNGERFARSSEGLRGRPPWRVEWKGPHRPPGYEQIPADLRIDHVYLVSCKYGSDIVLNSSPAHLFDRCLSSPSAGRDEDWYAAACASPYAQFWSTCRSWLSDVGMQWLPEDPTHLDRSQRREVAAALGKGRGWPGDLEDAWRWFALSVAQHSADRWRKSMGTKSRREEMAWRLLRSQAAPYFVLGSSARGHALAFRVGTPWDFRSAFEFVDLRVSPRDAGQPVVDWAAHYRDRQSGDDRVALGHIEIRWSHGRFSGHPEAKVYLDSPHHEVPGYVPIG